MFTFHDDDRKEIYGILSGILQFPYFIWSDVSLGTFICIHEPANCTELCEQNQIRVDEAEDEHLFDI